MKKHKRLIIIFMFVVILTALMLTSCNRNEESPSVTTFDTTSSDFFSPIYPKATPIEVNENGTYEIDRYTFDGAPFKIDDKYVKQETFFADGGADGDGSHLLGSTGYSEEAKKSSSIRLGKKVFNDLQYTGSYEETKGRIRHSFSDSKKNNITVWEGDALEFQIELWKESWRKFSGNNLSEAEIYDFCLSYIYEFVEDFDPTEYDFEMNTLYDGYVAFVKRIDGLIRVNYVHFRLNDNGDICRISVRIHDTDWSKCDINIEAVDKTISCFLNEYILDPYEIVDYTFDTTPVLYISENRQKLHMIVKAKYQLVSKDDGDDNIRETNILIVVK